MTKVENPDNCYVCGRPLPDDFVRIRVPSSLNVWPTVLSDPGVVELRFCCERHRRDWADDRYGVPDED